MIDQDTDSGQISQLSIDYFGLDKAGNVWLVGGYTEAYSGGQFTNTIDAWLGRARAARPGSSCGQAEGVDTAMVIQSNAGDGGSAAEVVDAGTSRCVPFACYKNVLDVREGKITAIDNGVQVLRTRRSDRSATHRARTSKHKDVEELVNLVQLSPTGLAERRRRGPAARSPCPHDRAGHVRLRARVYPGAVTERQWPAVIPSFGSRGSRRRTSRARRPPWCSKT